MITMILLLHAAENEVLYMIQVLCQHTHSERVKMSRRVICKPRVGHPTGIEQHRHPRMSQTYGVTARIGQSIDCCISHVACLVSHGFCCGVQTRGAGRSRKLEPNR